MLTAVPTTELSQQTADELAPCCDARHPTLWDDGTYEGCQRQARWAVMLGCTVCHRPRTRMFCDEDLRSISLPYEWICSLCQEPSSELYVIGEPIPL